MKRKAGVVLPLSSIRTRRDWGIGQVTDLPACASWIRSAGHRLIQILPPHELSSGETSPYGALTAFGVDPIYVDIDAIADLDPPAIASALGNDGTQILERVRAAPRTEYDAVRALKARMLRVAFDRFHAHEWERATPRAKLLETFVKDERAWLDDLALYTVLRESHGGYGWTTWPADQRDRSENALKAARRDHERRILEVAYGQWILLDQWKAARASLQKTGVDLMGDLPFIVGAESADVWSHASQFQLHVSLGAPPDEYSSDGQDWGLPAYDWLAMEADDFAWIRARVRHAARLCDRFRLDHVVGYFRQWIKRKDARDLGHFDPAGAEAQRARGERVLGAMIDELQRAGDHVEPPRAIAEDLGVVPPFVREVLSGLGMPGYKVLPWEKEHGHLRDRHRFPEASVASWSTHDTAPIDAWWDELPEGDRAQFSVNAGVDPSMDAERRSLALLRYLYGTTCDLALVLVQELLGVRDRINTPGTVGPQNWTWRLPRPIEDLTDDARLAARFEKIRGLVDSSGR
jgi:4-alpha-glucanotransferase